MTTYRWTSEFRADFDVPSLIADHPEVVSVSWHNDACPSFTTRAWDNIHNEPRLYVDHVDPKQREIFFPEGRYFILRDRPNGECDTLWEGDDAQQALDALLAMKPTDEDERETPLAPQQQQGQ